MRKTTTLKCRDGWCSSLTEGRKVKVGSARSERGGWARMFLSLYQAPRLVGRPSPSSVRRARIYSLDSLSPDQES